MSKLLTTTAVCLVLGLGAAAAQTTPPTPPTTETPKAAPESGSDRFMKQQSSSEVSADDLMGSTVYDSQDQKIGEVNDLIMDDQGKIQAAVIGVGGFLGMGEKDVAVKFDELQSRTEDDGDIRVMLNATKEQLKSAPTYAFMRDERRDQDPATGSTPRNDNPLSTPPNRPNPNQQ